MCGCNGSAVYGYGGRWGGLPADGSYYWTPRPWGAPSCGYFPCGYAACGYASGWGGCPWGVCGGYNACGPYLGFNGSF